MTEDIRHADELGLSSWDDDTPFPLTDSACASLLRGHAVRWSRPIAELDAIPARLELIHGWIHLRR